LDWTRAIEINRVALLRFVAELVAYLVAFEGVSRLPKPVHRSLGHGLYKAEAAVRRLIVIAARGLVVALPPVRPMPEGLVITGHAAQGPSRLVFPLFDTRVTYSFDEPGSAAQFGPRIRMFEINSPQQQFLSLFPNVLENLSSAAATRALRLRMEATSRALQNLSAEARRMARWLVRRKAMADPKFTVPLRPGPPPGHNRQSKSGIDLLLSECHALAWDALRVDSS
jgi:hypothetical protein